MGKRRLHPEKYTVGWVSALPIELAAAKVMLDEEHYTETDGTALYTLGRIGDHNVVLGCLPAGQIGTNSAAVVGTLMKARYKAIRFGLMVGIGGGVPSGESDIRLGDVVVSQPHLEHGGVIQYDFGKTTKKGFARTGVLSPPPRILLSALTSLRADNHMNTSRLSSYLVSFDSLPDFRREIAGPDVLFKSSYEHVAGATCAGCNRKKIVKRRPRGDQHAKIHYGTIASGNQVIKDAITRDQLSSKLGGILCFEMEAAGLMNTFPCLVIRGICDYADSHKNKTWQPHAAATAAACAKAIINIIPEDAVVETPIMTEATYARSIEVVEMTRGEKDCLQSLYFSEMYSRQNDITDPARDTCEWLSEHAIYKKWIDRQHPLLWIKGNPGAGKSTLLRYALTLHEQDSDEAKPIVAFFFFHGRGTEVQKSVLGLLRSLLHQILQHFHYLLRALSLIFKKRCKTEGEIGKKWNWQENDLLVFFKRHVPNAAQLRPIRIYIDALDESGEIVARKLVKFFEAITSNPNSCQASLSICFSCRHFPLVALENGFEICVDDENHQDIVTYMCQNIQSNIREEQIATKIQEEVLQRSLGNFQWVVLVLPKIIQSYRKGKWKTIQRYIQDIPSTLSELYGKLIEGIEEEDLPDSLQLFQWICFAKRPLSLKELRFAMIVDADTPYQSIHECEASERYANTDEEMKSRVLDLCRGLAEVKEHEGKRVAQFIHQSVKEYLIQSGLQAMTKSAIHSVIGSAHHRLSRACIRYISMKEIGDYVRNKSDAERHTKFDSEERDSLGKKFPFVKYAVTSWGSHAEMAEKEEVSQADLLSFLGYPSDVIIQLWIQLFEKIDNPIWRDFPGRETNLLHIASKFNLFSIIHPILRSSNIQVNSVDEKKQASLHLAAKNGHEAAVRLLIEQDDVEINLQNTRRETPLVLAAKKGCETVIKLLLQKPKIDVNTRDNNDQTPILIAAENMDEATIKLLLERDDIDVNCKDHFDQSPLFLTAYVGNETMTKLLLQKPKIDVNTQDFWGRTPLFIAVQNVHIATIKLLLERNDVDVNCKNDSGQTPLTAAAENGHEEIINLLIQRDDLEMNCNNKCGQTPLFMAAACGHEGVVKLLLSRHNIEWAPKDMYGRTPLDFARMNKREGVVELLESYIPPTS